ncbi:TonB-dependent receptor [Stigmatella sp. ncwal1]|uniref:TonB-dependent receptor n=1 Tax=Stigmatella ashevillensis TaxID=2995309 RepID=A0ABT5DA54_9BACT|nr:TonB-dependent receptor [Stigmatella ashevillena]MDC0709126.1 TonB-dependent receptor [Stigmatella ashevillena]
MRRILRATGLVVVVASSYGTAAYADSVILGTVFNAETQKPVADVVVTATSPNLQGKQEVVTDAQGQYRIPQLPPGVYTLRFDKESFNAFSRPEVPLRLDRTIRVNVELLPENATEAITLDVKGVAPTIDVGSTTMGINVDQDFIQRIAVNRPGGKSGSARSFESLAELAPGAQEDLFGVSINGTTSPENGYVVDGLSTNDPAFGVNASPLSVEFVQDVNIITGGYMPEYGRSTGGVLNAVTKSGSNEFHGSVYGTVTPGALEGTRDQVVSASSVIAGRNALDVMGDVGATLGGPLLKDKLWFFAGVAPNYSHYTHTRSINAYQTEIDPNSGQLVVKTNDRGFNLFTQIPGSERKIGFQGKSLQYIGKLTYLLNPDHNLSVSVMGTPTTSGGNGTISISPLTGLVLPRIVGSPDAEIFYTKAVSSTTSTALKYSGASNDKKLLIDANLGWFHQTSSTLPSDGSQVGSTTGMSGLATVVYSAPRPIYYYEPDLTAAQEACTQNGDATGLVACPVYSYYAAGPGYINEAKLDRVQANAKASYLLNALGTHVFKLGADVERLRYDNLKAYSGSVLLVEAANGAYWVDDRRYGFPSDPGTATRLPFLHSVTHSNTLGGFLQDSWTLAQRVTLNVGVRYDTQWLYGGDGNLAFSLPHQVSPRLGLVVDPLANGRMKVYANFARYYEQMPINLLDRAFPPEPRDLVLHTSGEGKCDPATIQTREGQATCLAASNSVPFNSTSGPTTVDPSIKPQSSDELLVGAEYEVLAHVRVGVSYTHRSMNQIIEDMSGDDSRFLGNPGQGLAQAFPKAKRNYDAMTLFLNRTFSEGWLAQASYTWSRLYGNYSGLFRPETFQLAPNLTSDFDLVALMENRMGLLPFDRTHAIKLFGAKEFDFSNALGASIGLSYRGLSGVPINYLGAHPIYGLNESFILDRGSAGRTPWVNNIDANIGVNYRVNRTNVLSLSVDVFNLFNFQQVTSVDEAYTFQNVLPITGGEAADGALTPDQVTVLDPATGLPTGNLSAEALNKNFRQPTSYQNPRQIRLGLKYTF